MLENYKSRETIESLPWSIDLVPDSALEMDLAGKTRLANRIIGKAIWYEFCLLGSICEKKRFQHSIL